MRSLGEDGDGYKYLGVLEADDINHMEMKGTVRKESFRQIRKIPMLNGSNIIQAINSLVRYRAGLIDWNKDEVCKIEWKTRRLHIIYIALHPQTDNNNSNNQLYL